MYRAVVIDDEPLVLEGIANSFQWIENGFDLPVKFSNSTEALKYILKNSPELVITDIKMPVMDGLELIRKLSESGNTSIIVIISGFADFEYARKAITYKVEDYILKPLDTKVCTNLIKSLKHRLDEKESEKSIKLIDGFLKGDISVSSTFNKCRYFYCAFITFKAQCDIYFERNSNFMVLPYGGNSALMLFSNSNIEYCRKTIESVKKDCDACVGISNKFDVGDNFKLAYNQAVITNYSLKFSGRDIIGIYSEPDLSDVRKLAKKLESAIVSGDQKTLSPLVREISQFLSESSNVVENAVFLNNTLKSIFDDYFEGRHSQRIYFEQINEEILTGKFRNVEEFIVYLEDIFDSLHSENETGVEDTNERIEEIKRYIDEHYRERLFLRDIADKFFINMNYLCQLFSSYFNCSFTDYITKRRMEESRNLLENTEFSINQIAQQVGYTDYYYFIRVFRNYFGTSPKKFKHNNINNLEGN